MRATIWIFMLGVVVAPAIAMAEVRKTTTAVSLRKRPGEKAAVVTKLPANTEVQIVREEGRWLLVRAKGVEGYLTRTTVTLPEAKPAGDGSGWSAARGAGTASTAALYVEVTSPNAILHAAPDAASATLATLDKGAKLAVVDAATHPSWVRGHDDAGHEGWIARAEVTDGATTVTIGSEVREVTPGGGFHRGPVRRLAIRTEVGLGMRTLGMDLTSNTDGGLANYIVDAQAIAATLAVDAVLRSRGRWFVGFDGALQVSNASPGIDYPGPTSTPGTIPFRTFATDAGVRGGLRARPEIDVSLRLGGHYDAFLTRDVDNVGMLPRERLAGLTAGARAEIAPPTSPFSAAVRLDALVVGTRAQTDGLEDGTSSTAHALWGGLTVRYAWSSRWAVFGAYDFARMTTDWSGMSARQPGVTETERIDTSQLVQLGIGAEL